MRTIVTMWMKGIWKFIVLLFLMFLNNMFSKARILLVICAFFSLVSGTLFFVRKRKMVRIS